MEKNQLNQNYGLASCCVADVTQPTMIDIHAKVVDEWNEPVPYAHVYIPETGQATNTAENGWFDLLGVPADANIVFSYQSNETIVVAGSIYNEVQIKTIVEGGPVIIGGSNNDNLKLLGFGILAVTVIYAMSRPSKNTKKESDKDKSTTKKETKKPTTKKATTSKKEPVKAKL